MPLYRDTGSMLPQEMQDVLAAIGMRDPQSAIPGPMATIGPKAIPLTDPRKYNLKIIGDVVADLRKAIIKKGDWDDETLENMLRFRARSLPGLTGEDLKGGIGKLLDETTAHSGMIGSFRKNIASEAGPELLDEMVQWLADMFAGRR